MLMYVVMLAGLGFAEVLEVGVGRIDVVGCAGVGVDGGCTDACIDAGCIDVCIELGRLRRCLH